MRLHIFGASGSGTTTLGAALAARRGCAHLDTDDFFWLPTDPPYAEQRPAAERIALLGPRLAAPSWVLSGSLCGWGDVFIPSFDRAVFLVLPQEVRLARLHRRERARFGDAALAPGGAMHANHAAFIDWAARYDDGGLDMRSRQRHEEWLARLPCPVLRVDGAMPTAEQVARVLDHPVEQPAIGRERLR